MTDRNDVFFELNLLNKTWRFFGIHAIADLIAWADEHASEAVLTGLPYSNVESTMTEPAPTPPTPLNVGSPEA